MSFIVGDDVEVQFSDNPYHDVGDVLPVWGVDPDKGIKLPDATGGAVWYDPSQLKLVPKATPKWELIAESVGGGEAENTSAMEMAGGCLVLTKTWTGESEAATSVFVPNSYCKDGFVVSRPARLQISKTQNILIEEVAAISKRADTLIFVLRCGKEITVSENADEVLSLFMEVSP